MKEEIKEEIENFFQTSETSFKNSGMVQKQQ
jgi:putative transposon-encoded protein